MTPAATEHITAAKTMTGKTTFQELLDWGVPEEAIQQIIGGELPALSTVIKDYVTGKGLEFSSNESRDYRRKWIKPNNYHHLTS